MCTRQSSLLLIFRLRRMHWQHFQINWPLFLMKTIKFTRNKLMNQNDNEFHIIYSFRVDSIQKVSFAHADMILYCLWVMFTIIQNVFFRFLLFPFQRPPYFIYFSCFFFKFVNKSPTCHLQGIFCLGLTS